MVILALFLVSFLTTFSQSVGDESRVNGRTGPVYVIPIKGDIEPSRLVFTRRGIREAEAAGAETIVFEINTFGGRVDTALQIATLIGSVRSAETVAYIPAFSEGTGVSWSAGALISFACGAIYMDAGTSIGAAAPVYQSPEGMQMAEEKTVSAVRGQLAALAEKNGYPIGVALAMVDKDAELIEVIVGEDSIPMLADEYEEYQVQAEEDGVEVRQGRVICPAGKLLTLTAGEMEKYGISSGTVRDRDAMLEDLGFSGVAAVVLNESLPDRLVAFITGSVVSSLLLLAGLVALYIEVTSPGFGVPGTVAIICFTVNFLGGTLLGTVGSVELLLFLLGIVLLAVEVFLIPGFGVVGISGVVSMLVALVLARQDFILPEVPWQWDIMQRNIMVVGGSLLGSMAAVAVLIAILPRTVVLNPLVLNSSQTQELGYQVKVLISQEPLVGKRGLTETPLRPVGKAVIDGVSQVVESDGAWLGVDMEIEVVEVIGNRILVREVT